jgi:uncharacterized membrane protein YqgA involved in biofilm formation
MTLLAQIIAALLTGTFLYTIAVLMTLYDGPLSLILQPLIGVAFTAAAIAVLLVFGLPLRLSRRLNLFWRQSWWTSFITAIVAFGLMLASWMPQFRVQVYDPELEEKVQSFHPALAIVGWMLAIFVVLHFYPTHLKKNP